MKRLLFLIWLLVALPSMAQQISGTASGHPYVDLGLPSGTLWATTNIGAKNPWECGDYFAWGETTSKSEYDWSTYKYVNVASNKLTKYCNTSDKGNNGYTDSRTTLERIDDVAAANWGSDWCMSTLDQIKELKDKCTWTWTTNYDIEGYEVTGPNGNSLFLPASGYRGGSELGGVGDSGYFWSCLLTESNPNDAVSLWFDSFDVDWDGISRCIGFTVRPVRCRN